MEYKLRCLEVRIYEVEYVVEAETEEEAKDLAAVGETVGERDIELCEVLRRSHISLVT